MKRVEAWEAFDGSLHASQEGALEANAKHAFKNWWREDGYEEFKITTSYAVGFDGIWEWLTNFRETIIEILDYDRSVEEPGTLHRRYVITWPDDYTDPPNCEVHTGEWFTTENGFNVEDIDEIDELELKQVHKIHCAGMRDSIKVIRIY